MSARRWNIAQWVLGFVLPGLVLASTDLEWQHPAYWALCVLWVGYGVASRELGSWREWERQQRVMRRTLERRGGVS